jgi:hypothetical protein
VILDIFKRTIVREFVQNCFYFIFCCVQ